MDFSFDFVLAQQAVLEDSEGLLNFLKILFGSLAAISAALPLAGLKKGTPVAKAKPKGIDGFTEGFIVIPPGWVIGLSTAATMFLIMNILALRGWIVGLSLGQVQRRAALAGLVAILCAGAYYSIYRRPTLQRPGPRPRGARPSRWGYATRDMVLALLYAAIFCGMTFAFTTLAYKLYLVQPKTQQASPSK